MAKALKFSKATQRDIESIVEAWEEFVADLRRPWTFVPGLVAVAFLAGLLLVCLLFDASELPW